MGIYDMIRGECPHCKCESAIQIKDWITFKRETTYTFRVGDSVPYLVDHITGKPIVETFREYCFKCHQDYQIPFKVIREEKNGILVFKVIMQEFQK